MHNTSVAFTVNGPTRYFIGRYDSDTDTFKAEFAPTGFLPKHEYFRASDVLWWAYLPGSEDLPSAASTAPVMDKPEVGRKVAVTFQRGRDIYTRKGCVSDGRVHLEVGSNEYVKVVDFEDMIDWEYIDESPMSAPLMPELGRPVVFKHKTAGIRVGQYKKSQVGDEHWFAHFSRMPDGMSRFYEPSAIIDWRYADELWALGEAEARKSFVDEMRATVDEMRGYKLLEMPVSEQLVVYRVKSGGVRAGMYGKCDDDVYRFHRIGLR